MGSVQHKVIRSKLSTIFLLLTVGAKFGKRNLSDLREISYKLDMLVHISVEARCSVALLGGIWWIRARVSQLFVEAACCAVALSSGGLQCVCFRCSWVGVWYIYTSVY